MFTDIKHSPAVIRGVQIEHRGRVNYISFVAVLGDADGCLLVFSESERIRRSEMLCQYHQS
jgi:hypothetical protein